MKTYVSLSKQNKRPSGKQKALLYNSGNMLRREYILTHIVNHLQYAKTLRILDVGCGVGDLAFEFFQKGMCAQYFLCDIDRNALIEAKTTLQYFPCEFIQADAQKLPFKSKTFDVVVCSGVLEHLPDDYVAMKEMKRVLVENV